MKSHADEIFENGDLRSLYSYAKGLEFALECIGKGVRMKETFTPCDSEELIDLRKEAWGRTVAAAELNEEPLDTTHFFRDFGPSNPCGKSFCSVCCPKEEAGKL